MNIETPPRRARQKALERQIRRLRQRLEQLQAIDRRFSWYRLGVFCLGVAATAWAANNLNTAYTWLILSGAVILFTIVVALHRRLDGWIARFNIWLEIRSSQLARMTLDWAALTSQTPETGGPERSSLEIDLDLSGPRSLHQLIDLAVSQEGSQLLRRWLSTPVPDETVIRARQQVVGELAGLPRFRDRLLLNLRLVSKEQFKGERLLKWLSVDYPSGRLRLLLLLAALFVLVNAALFALNLLGWLPAYWPFSLALYLAFYFYNSGVLNQFLGAVVELDNELDKFRALLHHLETYPYGHHIHLAKQCALFSDPHNPPSRQLRRIKLVTVGVGLRMNPVLGLLLNALLPWDFLFAFLAGGLRQTAAQLLPRWLEAWYELEALCSLANFAYLNPDYSYPEIRASAVPVFQASQLGHPLIAAERKVCNDFMLSELGELILITGSNMAGKSTFLKTVGANLCLAYAGGPVNAASLRARPFRLHTCMRITDSVTDGFSYFYAEVRCLRSLLDALRSDHPLPVLYLIDEIFRGTNNRERLIGSRAYTQALIGLKGAGLIATHDLELASLSEGHPGVKNFHFRDQVQERKLVFDYQIHPGPSPTTNALKIMQMEGLPVEVE